MQNKSNYPLQSHYLLLNSHTKKPFKITIYGKPYIFIVNRKYFLKPKDDFFSLKEMLYILSSSCDIIWSPISMLHMFYKTIFYNAILPSNLNLNIVNGKVIPHIEERSLLNA